MFDSPPPRFILSPVIDIIGAAFDLCGYAEGSRLGPAAIRLAGLQAELEKLGLKSRDRGDVVGPGPYTDEDGMRNFPPLLATVRGLRERTREALQDDSLPLVLGGEHTLAVGCVSAALDFFGGDLAVLWIDAHADINTPGSSETGNLHGMPLAALAGMSSGVDGTPDREWNKLLQALGTTKLDPTRIAWCGLRDVDSAERERLNGFAASMHFIDRHGIERFVDDLDAWLKKISAKRLWISFDVDALDPILAPGTGTAVRGGLTYREGHLLAELLHEALHTPDCPYKLAGVDLVEVNPLQDTNNATAKVAVEWVASLFGKTILGKATTG